MGLVILAAADGLPIQLGEKFGDHDVGECLP